MTHAATNQREQISDSAVRLILVDPVLLSAAVVVRTQPDGIAYMGAAGRLAMDARAVRQIVSGSGASMHLAARCLYRVRLDLPSREEPSILAPAFVQLLRATGSLLSDVDEEAAAMDAFVSPEHFLQRQTCDAALVEQVILDSGSYPTSMQDRLEPPALMADGAPEVDKAVP